MVPDERIDQGAIFLPRHALDLTYRIGWPTNVVQSVVKGAPQHPALRQAREVTVKGHVRKTEEGKPNVLHLQCASQALFLVKLAQLSIETAHWPSFSGHGVQSGPSPAH